LIEVEFKGIVWSAESPSSSHFLASDDRNEEIIRHKELPEFASIAPLTRLRDKVNRKNFLPPLLFNSSGTQSIPNSFFELHDLSKVPLNRDYEAQPDGRTRVNMNSVYGSTRIGPSSR